MVYNGLLGTFPKEIRLFIAIFTIVLSIGFFTGLLFVRQTEATTPDGVEQNYLGNENEELDVQIMKFEKGEREMLTIIHTHILSMSFIFFLLGGLVWLTKFKKNSDSSLLRLLKLVLVCLFVFFFWYLSLSE